MSAGRRNRRGACSNKVRRSGSVVTLGRLLSEPIGAGRIEPVVLLVQALKERNVKKGAFDRILPPDPWVVSLPQPRFRGSAGKVVWVALQLPVGRIDVVNRELLHVAAPSSP